MPEAEPEQHVLRTIEDRYWRPIEEVTSLESLLDDDHFFADPGRHVALFSDHGVVHVRDVAARAAELARRLDGVLIPARSAERSTFVAATAALLAYLHDIGMTPVNRWGRPVHAQYAAQVPYSDEFAPILDELSSLGGLGVRGRIEELGSSVGFDVPARFVLREVLATTVAHSKSTVPSTVLDRRVEFRDLMRRTVLTPLAALAGAARSNETDPTDASRRYGELGLDPERVSFTWLEAEHGPLRQFADDVVDAVRVLRAADALRQRGTTLRTSSGFEICADRDSGHGVFALRSANRRVLALFCDPNPFSGAEANLDEADLTDDGSLRLSFHRESFGDPTAAERIAAEAAALVVDIEADVLGSFATTDRLGAGLVELVRRDRDAPLIDRVAELVRRMPGLADRVSVIDAPPRSLAPDLREWSLDGVAFEPTPERVAEVVAELARHGMNTSAIDTEVAFDGVRQVRIGKDEEVFAPHTEATVVLIPMGDGLELVTTGGYGHRVVPAWVPAGVTGVVRHGERNAHVRAASEVDVLVVPRELFLAEWFRPYRVDEVRDAARGWTT